MLCAIAIHGTLPDEQHSFNARHDQVKLPTRRCNSFWKKKICFRPSPATNSESIMNDTMEQPLYLPWLCGKEDALWNSADSWETSNPTLSSCFRKSFWTFPPFILFWLLLPWEFRKLFRSTSRGIPLTCLNLSRVLATIFLLVLAIIDLFFWGLDDKVRNR